jgi:hypothetical protein
MLDDTGYFLPCSSAFEAAALTALCNDPIARDLIHSASFPDAKRPITKALLQRIDLRAILERADRRRLLARAATVFTGELAAGPAGSLSGARDGIDEVFSSLEQLQPSPPAAIL